MARYFQHLNPNDSNFQTITTLLEIDNSDPTMVLYYFADGSKCGKNYVGAVNDFAAYGTKELVELSNPNNKWVFDVKEIKRESSTPKYVTGANGERYEVPNMMDYTQSKAQEGTKVTVSRKPYFAPVNEEETDEKYIITNAKQATPIVSKQQVVEQPNVSNITTDFNEALPEEASSIAASHNTNHYIDAQYLLDKNKIIEFAYNGKNYSMPADEFFKNAVMYPEEKIIEKIVEKEVEKVVETPTHIEIGLDDIQKGLVDNMIDMAEKEVCDIDMTITLKLPPTSVYKLIKSVYPKGMSQGFVNIIADRMQIKELKMAVAQGLMNYYDEDANVTIVANAEAETAIIEFNEDDYTIEDASNTHNYGPTKKTFKKMHNLI